MTLNRVLMLSEALSQFVENNDPDDLDDHEKFPGLVARFTEAQRMLGEVDAVLAGLAMEANNT